MALFDNFPWTNIHQLNLDWVVKEIKNARKTQEEIKKNLPAITEEIILQMLADGTLTFNIGTIYNPINESLQLVIQLGGQNE